MEIDEESFVTGSSTHGAHGPTAEYHDALAVWDAEVERINGEFVNLQLHLCRTKQERNSVLPVSRLPPDVLIEIFKFLHPKWTLFRKGEKWDWLTLTRIDVYWRDLILRTASFWTSIGHFRSLNKFRTFLERSQDAELELNIISHYYTRRYSEIFKRHIERVRKLQLACGRVSPDSDALRAILILCKRLKELTVIVRGSVILDFTWMKRSNISFELNYLELRNPSHLPIPWNCTIYRGLRVLIISDDRAMTESNRPSLSELLIILETCCNLEELNLRGVGPRLSAVVPGRIVDLYRLEKIAIYAMTFKTYLTLFQHIRLSRPVSCNIFCTNYDFASVKPIIAPSLKKLIPSHYESLCVELSGRFLRFSFFREKEDVGYKRGISIRLLTISPNIQIYRSLPRLIEGDVLRDVKKTNIYFNKFWHEAFDKPMLVGLFSSVTNFQVLFLKRGPSELLRQIFSALMELAQNNKPRSSVGEIHFIQNRVAHERMIGRENDHLRDIVDYLRYRKIEGFPVRVVRFRQCKEIETTTYIKDRKVSEYVEVLGP